MSPMISATERFYTTPATPESPKIATGLEVDGKIYSHGEIAEFDVDAEKCFTPLCPNELPIVGGDEIVPELNAQARFAQKRVGSKDAHPASARWTARFDCPQFTPIQGEADVDQTWNRHGVPGTLGGELLDGLPALRGRTKGYDYFVWKGVETFLHPYGACYHDLAETMSTGVVEYLKMNEIKLVIVGGLATDYCVKTTVMQLVRAGLKVILNLGACRGIADATTQAAIDEMRTAGVVIINSAGELLEMVPEFMRDNLVEV